jgi:hypothetical protein
MKQLLYKLDNLSYFSFSLIFNPANPMIKKSLVILCLLFCFGPVWAQKKAKHPKNIILMVGDGMGVSQIYAGMIRKLRDTES